MEDLPVAQLDPSALLGEAPSDGYRLLELALDWPALDPAQRRIAARLRIFVITTDPLGWIPNRGVAWATANDDGDRLELVLYAALDALRLAGGDVCAALAPYAAAVVIGGARAESVLLSGRHPELVMTGATPRLLESLDAPEALAEPQVSVRSQGWEPLGLGAIEDLVQDAFGPVDLDRSPVRLGRAREPIDGCSACGGESFGFPADLQVAAAQMCLEHREAATATTAVRINRARQSNPVGWRAIGKASARINGYPEPGGNPLPPRTAASPGRNDPCSCGSGRKFKRCCGV